MMEFTTRQYGLENPDLDPALDIEFPACFNRAFNVWETLARCRHEGQPVNLAQIRDYKELYYVDLSPYEVDCILKLDSAFVKYSNTGDSE